MRMITLSAIQEGAERMIDTAVTAELEALHAEQKARKTIDSLDRELLRYEASEARVQRNKHLLRAEIAIVNMRRIERDIL